MVSGSNLTAEALTVTIVNPSPTLQILMHELRQGNVKKKQQSVGKRRKRGQRRKQNRQDLKRPMVRMVNQQQKMTWQK
jgi:hypothetical protein